MFLSVLVVALFLGAQTTDPRSNSTRAMAERLVHIYDQQDWKTDPNKQAERVAYYRSVLEKNPDLRTQLRARLFLAQMLLQAGSSAAAVDELEKLRVFASGNGIILSPAFDRELRQTSAMAYLRQGEQQNCLTNHNADSCVYPLSAGGIHQDGRGAQGAVREWTAMLESGQSGPVPDYSATSDLNLRWLLNIAYMALGQKAPERWRIPDTTLDSQYNIGHFSDVAPAAGVAITRHAGGVVAEDFDGDGLFDLVLSSSGPLDQLRYLHNNGDGSFSDQTLAAGLEGELGGLNVIHADFNNDGYPDLLVLRGGWWGKHGHYPFSLIRNNGPNAAGQVTFSDVTEAAGMLSLHPTQTAAWADFDNDGWLDLFVGHESSGEDPNPSELWRNNHDGTFTDIAKQTGLAAAGFVKGVAWGDYNNDGRPDLYISRDGEPNLLFRNDGADANCFWKFTDMTKAAGVAEPNLSFATWFFDYDNDGWLDLMVAGYAPENMADLAAFHLGLPNKQVTPRLYRNNHDGTFRDVSEEVGINRAILSMGAGFGDLDNDGWLDCYFGTGAPEYEALLPNRMFRNDHGRRFQDVSKSGGFGQLQKGHAIAFADFNRDGQQDVFEVLGGAYPGDTYISTLLANPGHGLNWINLKLVGAVSNRSAVGARVRVQAMGPDGRQEFHRVVQGGTSFGDFPFELHVGLGTSTAVQSVSVRWPSGRTQSFERLVPNSVYVLREEQKEPEKRPLRRFEFKQAQDSTMHHHEM